MSEIIIIGGGIVGLAIALELKFRGASVTVLSRDFQEAAGHAAAGMLAPQAEAIPPGAMLDLCLQSRELYPEWIDKLEQLTGIETGYWQCGILAPHYEVPRSPKTDSTAMWLDKAAIQCHQPGLSKDVVGGWWYPEDGQVDNRALLKSLLSAARALGVNLKEGVAVESIQVQKGKVTCLRTAQGKFQGAKYVLATGSWCNQLLPLPVRPVKGQMLSLGMPNSNHEPLPLTRVIFGPQTYLVPRRDGRLIVGATSEEVGWTPYNTPSGINNLLQRAINLYPALGNWKIEEFWWGFRPGTPDELPILGTSPWENLILATGHYRNGILLAPITAALLTDLILQNKENPLLAHFRYHRFTTSLPQPLNMLTPTNNSSLVPTEQQDELIIAGRTFSSRLMTGTGKYSNIEQMQQSIAASGSTIVTVAVRRVQTKAPGHVGLAEALDWSKIW
ncbi:MAG: glycine oxidase ThiO, partial [Prochloron sp. SP5CPC1]|nr:glycine oxidase ThiO [Candidatus Paraprochloron terpiosi SP5CPC1]